MFHFCGFPQWHFCHQCSAVATRLGFSRAGVNWCHSRTRAPCLGRWQALNRSFLFSLNFHCFFFTMIYLHVSYLRRCLSSYFIRYVTSTLCGGFSMRMPFLCADYTSHKNEQIWLVYNCGSINVED